MEIKLNILYDIVLNLLYRQNSKNNLEYKSVCPQSIIQVSIAETFNLYDQTSINFLYKFNHNKLMFIDHTKVLKVFNSLIAISIENMGCQGNLWFHTYEVIHKGNIYIKFHIGNDNQYMNKHNLVTYFTYDFHNYDAGKEKYFLSLKEIKAIIESHGGKIWCQSEINSNFPNGKFEFIFILPISKEYYKKLPTILPKDSIQIFKYSRVFRRIKNFF